MDTSDILVMDESGKVEEWLNDSNVVHVWQNLDLGSVSVGSFAFTRCTLTLNNNLGAVTIHPCADHPPHWHYGTPSSEPFTSIRKGDPRVRIFRPVGVASGIIQFLTHPHVEHNPYTLRQVVSKVRFSDTTAGIKAAWNACGKLNDAAIEAGPRTAPIGRFWATFTVKRLTYQSAETRADGRPLGYFAEYAVIEWSATDGVLAKGVDLHVAV